MDLQEYFAETKRGLTKAIADCFAAEAASAPALNGYPKDLFRTLADYACSGKMLRGILARLGAELFADPGSPFPPPLSPGLAKLGAALELFQAGLLAHDDIMDQDDSRRGQPTLHRRFEAQGRALAAGGGPAGYAGAGIGAAPGEDGPAPQKPRSEAGEAIDFLRLGESWAICAGDLYFFSAYKLISEALMLSPAGLRPAAAPAAAASRPLSAELGLRFSSELAEVCLAQAADVGYGTFASFPSLEEVLRVYEYKTARYTMALPLAAGAIFAGAPRAALPGLEALATPLGIVFQLQDDRLGLFGDERKLGKPIGSDIREGKKTPYMVLLEPRLAPGERKRFSEVFGAEDLDAGDLEFIRGLVRSHGVDGEVEELSEQYRAEAFAALEGLAEDCGGLNGEAVRLLGDFVEYSMRRES